MLSSAAQSVTTMTDSLVLDLAFDHPTKIDRHVRLLQIASRTSSRAAFAIQTAWKVYRKRSAASIRIQKCLRGFLRRQTERKEKTQDEIRNKAATKIQRMYRFVKFFRFLVLAVEVRGALGFSGDIPVFDSIKNDEETPSDEDPIMKEETEEETSGMTDQEESSAQPSANTQTGDEGIDDMVTQFINELWTKGAEYGLLCNTEEEAVSSEFNTTVGLVVNPKLLLHVMSSAEVDVDTKILCHRYLNQFLWHVVELSCSPVKAEEANESVPPEVLAEILNLCITNLGSRNYGTFRGAVSVLSEARHIQRQEHMTYPSIPKRQLVKLLNFLRRMFAADPSFESEFNSFSTLLPSRKCRVNWGSHVGFQLLNTIPADAMDFTWQELTEVEYFKTIVLIYGFAHGEKQSRCRFVVSNIWDSWPTGDPHFQKFLRDSVHAVIGSKNFIERCLLETYAMFIMRGIKLESIPMNVYVGPSSVRPVGVYDPSDKRASLSCNCMAKLLIDIFVAAHEVMIYFDEAINAFRKEFHLASFELLSPTGRSKEKHGVFRGHESLQAIIDFSKLNENLNEKSTDKNQLIALYVLRGLPFEEILKYVPLEVYVSALRRFPATLQNSWFHRGVESRGSDLHVYLAHCAASIDDVQSLRMYGGDFSLLVEPKTGNTLLHTAAFYGSIQAVKYLIAKGVSVAIRNGKSDSPADIAKRRKHRQCLKLLLDRLSSEQKASVDDIVTEIKSCGCESVTKPKSKKKKKRKRGRIKQGPFLETRSEEDFAEASSNVEGGDVPHRRLAHESRTLSMEKDAMMEIFSIHNGVPENAMLIEIVNSKVLGEKGILELEEVNASLDSLVVESFGEIACDLPFDLRINLCQQLLQAIKVLHTCGVVHGSIHPKNIFYVRSSDRGEMTLKLGVVSTRRPDRVKNTDESRAFRPAGRALALTTESDLFAIGCVISFIICGHHIFGLDTDDQQQNIADGIFFNRRQLESVSSEGFDLVQRMVTGIISIDECLSHPMFWSPVQKFRYISELVRTQQHRELPSDETLGLGKDWRKRIRPDGALSRHMKQSPSLYSSLPCDFLRLCRNMYHHPPRASDDDPFDDAMEDFGRFPVLFPALFEMFGDVIGGKEA